jgi:hypothetical protein
MKIYLASFIEPENFGDGRVISITDGGKPKFIHVDLLFTHLIPSQELMTKYYELFGTDQKAASDLFTTEYKKQLNKFAKSVEKVAKEKNVKPIDILPFKQGDTLASWERSHRRNYRKMVAPVLEKLGYEVVLN